MINVGHQHDPVLTSCISLAASSLSGIGAPEAAFTRFSPMLDAVAIRFQKSEDELKPTLALHTRALRASCQ